MSNSVFRVTICNGMDQEWSHDFESPAGAAAMLQLLAMNPVQGLRALTGVTCQIVSPGPPDLVEMTLTEWKPQTITPAGGLVR